MYLTNDEICDNDNTVLWHYTSADGLLGMFQGNGIKFWLTRSDCLNDTSEGEEITKLFFEACNELRSEQVLTEKAYIEIIECKPSQKTLILYPLPPHEGIPCTGSTWADCEKFICSFSIAKDSLDMWRYYSSSGGYALGFSWSELYRINGSSFDPYVENGLFCFIRLMNVYYDEKQKKEFLKREIRRIYNENSNYLVDLRFSIEQLLSDTQFSFKHPCFANEQEWRLVFYRPIDVPEELKLNIPPIKYRQRDGMIIPYIEVTSPYITKSLQSLHISPFLREKHTETQVKGFLESKGFKDCQVVQSHLPVRF